MQVYLQLYGWHDAWALPEPGLDRLRTEFPEVEFVHHEQRHPDPETLAASEVLIAWRLRERFFEHAGDLEWHHTPAAGVGGQLYDDYIESDIRLTNGSGLNSAFVAEHGLALMLAWLRGVHLMDPDGDYRETRERVWDRHRLMRPFHDKCTLVVGFGHIGRSLARRLGKLGQTVTGVRRANRVVIEDGFRVFPADALDSLLAEHDFVVNCLPLTDATFELFGTEQFERMPESCCFVNLGRGKTVDEAALVEAVESGGIAGAALDVFAEEPLPDDSPLRGLDEVLISPHVAATTADTWQPQLELIERNLRHYLDGERLLNLVDKQRGY